MRRVFILILLSCLWISCESDDNLRQNPNLPNIAVQFDINLNLPQYSALGFPGNFVIINNQGLRGFVVYTPGNNQYVAYDLADPNRPLDECSRMEVSGLTATSPCAQVTNEYNIFTGQPTSGDLDFGMKPYRVERQGNIIRVSNL